jgi:hypothetical protein
MTTIAMGSDDIIIVQRGRKREIEEERENSD